MDKSHDKTRVVILTNNFRITGNIYKFKEVRLTDCISESGSFIAVTFAEVKDHFGHHILTSDFLNVLKNSIEIIFPEDQLKK
jgi:hypothetical protein